MELKSNSYKAGTKFILINPFSRQIFLKVLLLDLVHFLLWIQVTGNDTVPISSIVAVQLSSSLLTSVVTVTFRAMKSHIRLFGERKLPKIWRYCNNRSFVDSLKSERFGFSIFDFQLGEHLAFFLKFWINLNLCQQQTYQNEVVDTLLFCLGIPKNYTTKYDSIFAITLSHRSLLFITLGIAFSFVVELCAKIIVYSHLSRCLSFAEKRAPS